MNCLGCGKDLSGRRAGSRYCSDRCRKRTARGDVRVSGGPGATTEAQGRCPEAPSGFCCLDPRRIWSGQTIFCSCGCHFPIGRPTILHPYGSLHGPVWR